MKTLCVQIQPERAPGLDEASARDILLNVGAGTGVVHAQVTEGYDGCRYINIQYATDDLPRLWTLIKEGVLNEPKVGPLLARCMIVVCQGEAGWDDYLLLHHFDGAEPLDSLPAGPPAGP
jgi:hypothetical protein